MKTTTNTSKLAIVAVAVALAIAASPATAQMGERWDSRDHGALDLPSLPTPPGLPPLPSPLELLPPLPSLSMLLSHLLPPLALPPWSAYRTWSDDGYYGPRRWPRREYRRFARPETRFDDGWYGGRPGYVEGRRMPRPYVVPHHQRPPLRFAPRTWSNHEAYGPRRQTRGEERRFAGPERGRRSDRQSDRRSHSNYGDWRH